VPRRRPWSGPFPSGALWHNPFPGRPVQKPEESFFARPAYGAPWGAAPARSPPLPQAEALPPAWGRIGANQPEGRLAQPTLNSPKAPWLRQIKQEGIGRAPEWKGGRGSKR
jgi:hypothetical protein